MRFNGPPLSAVQFDVSRACGRGPSRRRLRSRRGSAGAGTGALIRSVDVNEATGKASVRCIRFAIARDGDRVSSHTAEVAAAGYVRPRVCSFGGRLRERTLTARVTMAAPNCVLAAPALALEQEPRRNSIIASNAIVMNESSVLHNLPISMLLIPQREFDRVAGEPLAAALDVPPGS